MNLKNTTIILLISTVCIFIGMYTHQDYILSDKHSTSAKLRNDIATVDLYFSDPIIEQQKQLALLAQILVQFTSRNIDKYSKFHDKETEFVRTQRPRLSKILSKANKLVLNPEIPNTKTKDTNHIVEKKPLNVTSSNIKLTSDIDSKNVVLPKIETLELDSYKQTDELKQTIKTKNTSDSLLVRKQLESQNLKKLPTNNSINIDKLNHLSNIKQIGYWQTVHSIESKQGKLLYRPRNKSRNCTYTSGPCGHHQLTAQALKDIGCNTKQCRKDRLDYEKSLKLSKKLLALNEKRLKKNGISKLEDYQKYLIHQQGANGIKNIIAATKGKKELSKNIKKNMANNSPYSYSQLKRMGSKNAADKFMRHWEQKWSKEKLLIIASQSTTSYSKRIEKNIIPTFDESELTFAYNVRF